VNSKNLFKFVWNNLYASFININFVFNLYTSIQKALKVLCFLGDKRSILKYIEQNLNWPVHVIDGGCKKKQRNDYPSVFTHLYVFFMLGYKVLLIHMLLLRW